MKILILFLTIILSISANASAENVDLREIDSTRCLDIATLEEYFYRQAEGQSFAVLSKVSQLENTLFLNDPTYESESGDGFVFQIMEFSPKSERLPAGPDNWAQLVKAVEFMSSQESGDEQTLGIVLFDNKAAKDSPGNSILACY